MSKIGSWLHALKDEQIKRVDKRKDVAWIAKTELAQKISQIEWDLASLIKARAWIRVLRREAYVKQIGVSPERRFDDAFIIYAVNDDYVWNCQYGMQMWWLVVDDSWRNWFFSGRMLAVSHQIRP